MKPFKIGVMVDSFRLGIAEGIRKAAEVGAEGIPQFLAQFRGKYEDFFQGRHRTYAHKGNRYKGFRRKSVLTILAFYPRHHS
jgi:hypothetical protein